jgi:hypothetical protein
MAMNRSARSISTLHENVARFCPENRANLGIVSAKEIDEEY